jgi:hypothetical protein
MLMIQGARVAALGRPDGLPESRCRSQRNLRVVTDFPLADHDSQERATSGSINSPRITSAQ